MALALNTALPYYVAGRTVAETPIFQRYAADIWSHAEREEFINVGFGSDLTIRELAETVRTIVGFEGDIVWDASRPDGTPRKLMDTSRLFALGWKPEVDLEIGIRLAYADFLKRFPTGNPP